MNWKNLPKVLTLQQKIQTRVLVAKSPKLYPLAIALYDLADLTTLRSSFLLNTDGDKYITLNKNVHTSVQQYSIYLALYTLHTFLDHRPVVDNLKPTDIVVSFSALSHWNDPPPLTKEDSKLNMTKRERESKGDALANENSSITEGLSHLYSCWLKLVTWQVLLIANRDC